MLFFSHDIREDLLDEAYARSIAKLGVSLKGQTCTIGWTDTNGKAVLNYMAVAGKSAFLLESHYTGAKSHDANFLAEDIERVIHKYDFLDMCAVVTNNTAANQKVWELLQPKFPRGFFHGCACHAFTSSSERRGA